MKTIIDYILESKGMNVIDRDDDSISRQSRPRNKSGYTANLHTSDPLKKNPYKLNKIIKKKSDAAISAKLKNFINSLDAFSKTKCLCEINRNEGDLVKVSEGDYAKIPEYKSITATQYNITNGYKNYMQAPYYASIQWNISVDDKTVFNKIKSALTSPSEYSGKFNNIKKTGIYTYNIKSYNDFYNSKYNKINVKLNPYQFMQPCTVGINDDNKIITITILSCFSLAEIFNYDIMFINNYDDDFLSKFIKEYSTINGKPTYTEYDDDYDYLAVEKHWFNDIWESMFKNLKTVNDIVKQYEDNIEFFTPDEYDNTKKDYKLISKESVLGIIEKYKGKKIFMREGYGWKGKEEYEITDMKKLNKILDWAAASTVSVKKDGIHINSFSNNDLE